MLIFVHTVYNKNRMKAWRCYAICYEERRYKKCGSHEAKKSSFVSRNQLAEKKLSHSPAQKVHCVPEYTFLRSRMVIQAFWFILETFYSGNKVPLILFVLVNYIFVSNFKENANLFSNYLASQCIPITNSSALPIIIFHGIETRLASLHFDHGDILKITRSSNVNGALSWWW